MYICILIFQENVIKHSRIEIHKLTKKELIIILIMSVGGIIHKNPLQ